MVPGSCNLAHPKPAQPRQPGPSLNKGTPIWNPVYYDRPYSLIYYNRLLSSILPPNGFHGNPMLGRLHTPLVLLRGVLGFRALRVKGFKG